MKIKRLFYLLIDLLLITIAGIFLYNGSSWQFSNKQVDAAIYQCYAVAFWQGAPGIQSLPQEQCASTTNNADVISVIQRMEKYHVPHVLVVWSQDQLSKVHFHTLPHEYPILALVPFSLPLIAPAQWYQQTFAIWSILFIALLYFLLKRYASTRSAIFFLICLVIAGWSTAVSRFDLFPAGLTLVALLLAQKKKWTLAYVFIIAAILMKFYPVLLLPIVFIAQQSGTSSKWLEWKRWRAVVTASAIGLGIICVSLLINTPRTFGALNYFASRPLEIESLAGSLVWAGSFFGYPYHYVYAFVSLNVASALSNPISMLVTGLLILTLLYTFWLQYRGRLDIATAGVVVITSVLTLSKILSPQYMIWVLPLAFYACRHWLWIIPWVFVSILTCEIYPVLYTQSSPPPTAIFAYALVRGLVLLGIIVYLLVSHTFKTRSTLAKTAVEEQTTPVLLANA